MSEPRKVYQTITKGPDANCLAACLATFLGLECDDIPYIQGDDWRKQVTDWLLLQGYIFATASISEEVLRTEFSRGYIIVVGPSKRGRTHAVIYKDGRLWHDPHPESTGLAVVEEVDLIIKQPPGGYE